MPASRSLSLGAALLHAVGEEPTEALIEPALEAIQPIEEEVQQGEHTVRFYMVNSTMAPIRMYDRKFLRPLLLGG